MIKFFFNGQEYFTNNDISIKNILLYFNYNNELFIIEYNGIICSKNSWLNYIIKNNDRLEIITIVGGG